MLVYDIEIEKAILKKNESKIDGIVYCNGWKDFEGMGISCVGAYDYDTEQYHIYCEDNLKDSQKLIEKHDVIVGFNNWSFDDKLIAVHNIIIPKEKSYDILVEIWKSVGLGSEYVYPSHSGYSLGQICKANFNFGKTGDGGNAPVLWQQGFNGTVINYCIHDVWMSKKLLDKIIIDGYIYDPKNIGEKLFVKKPMQDKIEEPKILKKTVGLKRN